MSHGTRVIHEKDEPAREGNKEADKLANGNAEDFDPSLRIEVNASTLNWDILPEALEGRGSSRTTVTGSSRTRHSPGQVQERQETKDQKSVCG